MGGVRRGEGGEEGARAEGCDKLWSLFPLPLKSSNHKAPNKGNTTRGLSGGSFALSRGNFIIRGTKWDFTRPLCQGGPTSGCVGSSRCQTVCLCRVLERTRCIRHRRCVRIVPKSLADSSDILAIVRSRRRATSNSSGQPPLLITE